MVMVLGPDKRAKQSQAARSKKSPTAEQAATNGQTQEPKAEVQVAIDPVVIPEAETQDVVGGDDGPES